MEEAARFGGLLPFKAAVYEFGYGTKLPFRDVRHPVASQIRPDMARSGPILVRDSRPAGDIDATWTEFPLGGFQSAKF